jgi:hypothetical protein
MVDLARVTGKFATNKIYALDPVSNSWRDTGVCGGLQVYDRFITDRSFGQKKRILTLGNGQVLPTEYGTFMLEGGSSRYLLESLNEDVRFNGVYGNSYLVHTASVEVELLNDLVTERASGAKEVTGQEVVATHWADIERIGAERSKELGEVNYTTVEIAFPKIAVLDTSLTVRVTSTGAIYNIEQVYDSLDLLVVKAKRMGG